MNKDDLFKKGILLIQKAQEDLRYFYSLQSHFKQNINFLEYLSINDDKKSIKNTYDDMKNYHSFIFQKFNDFIFEYKQGKNDELSQYVLYRMDYLYETTKQFPIETVTNNSVYLNFDISDYLKSVIQPIVRSVVEIINYAKDYIYQCNQEIYLQHIVALTNFLKQLNIYTKSTTVGNKWNDLLFDVNSNENYNITNDISKKDTVFKIYGYPYLIRYEQEEYLIKKGLVSLWKYEKLSEE